MDQENTHALQPDQQQSTLRSCPKCDTVFSAIAYCPNDGTKLEEVKEASSSYALFSEKYEILDELGKGGMGTVYRVKQVMLDKIFALKVIPSHYLSEQLAIRFQREAKTMASLDHPNLARILDFGIWLNQPFMVMEYVDGQPLSRLISERVISPNQAIELFCQILDGLSHAHEKGVLHRDIKPSNIMVKHETDGNKAVLLDFGIAKKIEKDDAIMATQALTRTGEMIGSPLYMSPEQARGEKLTERSDLYSLGCALFESLTGTPPFVGKTAVETFFLHIEHAPPSLKEAALGRDFPPGLERVCRRLLAKNPEDRFESALELKSALSQCLSTEEQSETKNNAEKKKAIPLAFTGLAVVAIAVLAAVSTTLFQGEKTAKLISRGSRIESPALSDSADAVEKDIFDENGRLKTFAGGQTQEENSEFLRFSKKNLPDETVQLIKRDKRLKRLEFSYMRLPEGILGQLSPTLEFLELNGVGLFGSDFKALAQNTNLRALVLRSNLVTAKETEIMSHLQNLYLLNLDGTHIDAKALKPLLKMPRLTNLIVSNNVEIDDIALQVISRFPNLEYLDISNTAASPDGIKHLGELKTLQKLIAKSLTINDKNLAELMKLNQISELNIADNNVSDTGLKCLTKLKNLRALHLSEMQTIDDEAIPSILQLKNLTELHISSTLITREGFQKLSALPHLKRIWARGLSLNLNRAISFMDACPTCDDIFYSHNDSDRLQRKDLDQVKQLLKRKSPESAETQL